jgi:predicted deacetylase
MLLASIHDVSPRFERQVDLLVDRLAKQLGDGHFAMLVVPDFWGEAPLRGNRHFAERLRLWAGAGVEMFLHGWQHRDPRPSGFAGRHLTAGEGEFSAIEEQAAAHLLRSGRAVLEDIIGRPITGFVAPGWLYSAGARRALANEGFALAEDHLHVWQPGSGRTLARGPVITWASRSRARRNASLLAAAVLSRTVDWQAVVRLGVHPGDVGSPALLRSIEDSISRLSRRHAPGRYADLLPLS